MAGRGLFGGGYTSSSVNVIDYVTIASAGNASDFGDLTGEKHSLAACANLETSTGWTHKIHGILNANIDSIVGVEKANVGKVWGV